MDIQHSSPAAVVLTPRVAGLGAGEDNTIEVLVRVQAPDAPPHDAAARAPQALALVIDRSGSMAGAPLAEARRCAEYVVSRLRPDDRVALVAFDHRVEVLSPAAPVGDGALLRERIAALHSRGNTNLHGGWLAGALQLSALPGDGLKRVLLLSDGAANEGQTDAALIAGDCVVWAAKGVSTSTYGLGRNFNEDLMVAMAQAGGGSHYYGETAQDLFEPFEQELDLLANLCLRQLKLSVTSAHGAPVQMLNELRACEVGWRLPDLAWGAEAWALVRVTLPADALAAAPGVAQPVLSVHVTGQDLDGHTVALTPARLALPVLSRQARDALGTDGLVERRLLELDAARHLRWVREAADGGDWAGVERLLAQASQRFGGHAWLAATLQAMRELAAQRSAEMVKKEVLYSSRALHSRLVAKDEAADFQRSLEEPSYLSRKARQGKADPRRGAGVARPGDEEPPRS